MPSQIIIQINSLPTPDVDFIFFRNDSALGEIRENAKVQRNGARQMTTSTVSTSQQSLFLQQAFAADFNTFSDFSFEFPTGNQLKIIKKTGENYFFGAFVGGNTGPGAWAQIIDISSSPDEPPLEVTDFNYLPSSTNPCGTVDLEITTNKQVDLVRILNQDFNPTTNPFIINISRFVNSPTLQFFANDERYDQIFYPPVQFFIDRVNQRFTPNGYAAEIVVTATGISSTNILNELEYSLDNVNFQMSNNFPSLGAGNFTAYVRDPYGCEKTIDFTIVEDESSVDALPTYFLYPKSNSIQMVLRDDKPSNINNTLSCEEEGLNQYPFYHRVPKSWVTLTNQFRSTYDDHILTLVDDQDNETNITVDKVSNNINIFDSRDAYLTLYDDNCVGVYLNGGNLYDAQTLDVKTGANLFGRIPVFYRPNSFIKLGNDIGWYQITEILYDENISSFVAKTNYRANSVSTDPIIATVNYNQLNYEVYEIDLDWNSLQGCYYFKMDLIRGNEVLSTQSEVFEVGESFQNVHELISSNSENSDINYNTQRRIQHKLLLPYLDLKSYDSNTNVDINRSDTKITHLSGSVTDRTTFVFDLLPAFMVEKVARLLALDGLFINGIGYTNPEIENERMGNTNLYSMTVTLTPNGEQFESNSDLRVISNIDNGGFVVVDGSGGFLKHDN